MKKTAKKKLSIPEQRRLAREAAFPEVKALVKKFGRATVSGCLARLYEYDKRKDELWEARQKVAQLERSLR